MASDGNEARREWACPELEKANATLLGLYSAAERCPVPAPGKRVIDLGALAKAVGWIQSRLLQADREIASLKENKEGC